MQAEHCVHSQCVNLKENWIHSWVHLHSRETWQCLLRCINKSISIIVRNRKQSGKVLDYSLARWIHNKVTVSTKEQSLCAVSEVSRRQPCFVVWRHGVARQPSGLRFSVTSTPPSAQIAGTSGLQFWIKRGMAGVYICPPLLFCCSGRTLAKGKVGRKMFISFYTVQSIAEGSQGQSSRQDPRARAWRDTADWLAPFPFLYSLGISPNYLQCTGPSCIN